MSKSKSDLIAAIAEKSGITKAQATVAVDTFKEFIVENSKGDDKVMLMGIGTFSTQKKPARDAKDPKGNAIHIAAKTVLKFKPSKDILEQLQ